MCAVKKKEKKRGIFFSPIWLRHEFSEVLKLLHFGMWFDPVDRLTFLKFQTPQKHILKLTSNPFFGGIQFCTYK